MTMMKRILAAMLSLMMLTSCGFAADGAAEAGAGEEAAAVEAIAEEQPLLDPVADAWERLVHTLARQLMQQAYTLDILTGSGQQSVCLSSSDEESILLEIQREGRTPIRIRLGGMTVSDPDGGECRTYPEALEQLLPDPHGENIAGQALALIGTLDERDLDLLKTAGELAYYELANAGAIPSVTRMDGDTYFALSLTPDLIVAAGVRFIERLLENQVGIDSLLSRAEPLLRRLVPELSGEYDSGSGMYAERGSYTCAGLQAMFESWMAGHWLRSRTEFQGMHLDISGRLGKDGWRMDANFFMPSSDFSLWLELSGDRSGSLDGMLEYCAEGYSRLTERREMQAFRFSIDGAVTANGFSVRVRPETPISGFTGLRIDCAANYTGLVVDATTDVLDFRMEAAEHLLDLSFVLEELLLDVHLTHFSSIPQGSLIFRNDRDGIYLKLNKGE